MSTYELARYRMPTKRELEIVTLLASGLRNAEIASELHISVHTIGDHIKHIQTKLYARNRVSIAVLALQAGWIKLDEIRVTT